MKHIKEQASHCPVAHECDVCVVGGSCTGVFAAVRAAQLGAQVALIENHGFFGGVATAGLVNVWHSLQDTVEERPIIGGLTKEIIERLVRRGAVVCRSGAPWSSHVLNSAELIIELDALVSEHPRIRPFLHARFVKPVLDGDQVTHAIIEDKSGRRAIRAACFIDASGDGDLIARAGLPFTKPDELQPPTTCAHLHGLDTVRQRNPDFDLHRAATDPQYPNAIAKGFMWGTAVPGLTDTYMLAGTRVSGADCSDADALTLAEMEGRRQVRAACDIVRDHYEGGENVCAAAVASYIGIRETRHATCLHRVTGAEVLEGVRFPDAIANGSYRVDIHHSDRPGVTLRYLDGREDYAVPGEPTVQGRWREERSDNPTFYQIPFRSLVPRGSQNILVAGRLVDADPEAYGAMRVMVNCNQTGEAAGVAAALSLDQDLSLQDLAPTAVRAELTKREAVII